MQHRETIDTVLISILIFCALVYVLTLLVPSHETHNSPAEITLDGSSDGTEH